MYGCRRLIILVNSITNTNPQHDEKTYEGNDAKGKVARIGAYSP